MAEWSIAAVLKTVEVRASGGSNPSLSAGGLQKVFTRVFNLAFKKVDNRCKIKVLQRFFFVYSPIA